MKASSVSVPVFSTSRSQDLYSLLFLPSSRKACRSASATVQRGVIYSLLWMEKERTPSSLSHGQGHSGAVSVEIQSNVTTISKRQY